MAVLFVSLQTLAKSEMNNCIDSSKKNNRQGKITFSCEYAFLKMCRANTFL